MDKKKIIVRKSLQFRTILFFLLISTIMPVLLFQFYYLIKKKSDLKVLKSVIEQKLPFVEKKIINFYNQYGIDKDSIILNLKFWDEVTSINSFDKKTQAIMLNGILLEQFWLVPNKYVFSLGKIYYQLGADYYPESLYYLKKFISNHKFSEQKVAINSIIDKAQTMIYQVQVTLGDYQDALIYVHKLLNRYNKTNQKTLWQINLANVYLLLKEKNIALNYFEDVFVTLTDNKLLEEIGLTMINTSYQLRLYKKTEFYYNFLIEKKVLTKKYVVLHRLKMKQKYNREIL